MSQSLNHVLSSVRACPLCAFCPPPSSSCCFRLHREIHATLLPFLLFPVMFFFISLYGSVLAFFVTLLIVWFLFLSLKERGPCPGRQLGYSPVSLMPLRPGFKGAQRLSRTLTPGVAQSCCRGMTPPGPHWMPGCPPGVLHSSYLELKHLDMRSGVLGADHGQPCGST